MTILSRPLSLFRRVAIAEAITWALLLIGMFLKYVTETTDLGVRIFGMIHGIVFIGYVVTTVVVWVDQRWTARRGVVALVAAVPPFVTLIVELLAVRRGWAGEAWRLRDAADDSDLGRVDGIVRWLLVAPVRGLLVGLVAVAALTGIALLVGPPASS